MNSIINHYVYDVHTCIYSRDFTEILIWFHFFQICNSFFFYTLIVVHAAFYWCVSFDRLHIINFSSCFPQLYRGEQYIYTHTHEKSLKFLFVRTRVR